MTLTKRKRSHDEDRLLENGDLDTEHTPSNVAGDKLNILILLFLYTLQGIPLGLAGAIPMLLANRGISYTEQAKFSLVNWPFSLKLLWAPLVDALFLPKFGRRKTWLVPVQYMIGLGMLLISSHVTEWLGSEHKEPSMLMLTGSFFMLNFLAATQDIAVDGWALTMLKRCNVGHASTCNSVGQTAGFFLGYVVFVALESESFCNSYLRKETLPDGIVTLESFLIIWAWIFIVSTTLVAIFKHEKPVVCVEGSVREEGLKEVYKAYEQLYAITKLPSVRTLALVLLTAKVGFSACDAVSSLKLVEAGVPKEDLALLAIPLVPVQIIMPLILSKYTTGRTPLSMWLRAFPLRLALGPVVAIFVAITPSLLGQNGPSIFYLALLVLLYMFHQACLYSMFVAIMAFFARVSDPRVGGTYMTLLNTLSNLGTNWPNTFSLWAIDRLSFKQCSKIEDNVCSTLAEKEACIEAGGSCITNMDGYYIESAVCLVIGFLWLQWGRPTIQRLQTAPSSVWQLPTAKTRRVR